MPRVILDLHKVLATPSIEIRLLTGNPDSRVQQADIYYAGGTIPRSFSYVVHVDTGLVTLECDYVNEKKGWWRRNLLRETNPADVLLSWLISSSLPFTVVVLPE